MMKAGKESIADLSPVFHTSMYFPAKVAAASLDIGAGAGTCEAPVAPAGAVGAVAVDGVWAGVPFCSCAFETTLKRDVRIKMITACRKTISLLEAAQDTVSGEALAKRRGTCWKCV